MIDFSSMWSGLDWGVIILYFVFIIAVGLTMRRRASKNMKNYFVAARRLTIPVLIGVGSASWIDSWSIVGLAECGTTMGICILFIYVIPNTILRLPLALWIGPDVYKRQGGSPLYPGRAQHRTSSEGQRQAAGGSEKID